MSKKREISPGTVHKSGEDYLEAILILSTKKDVVRSIDIANFLNYSKPSVSVAMSFLKDANYITMDDNHFIYLTEEGRKIASKIYERHEFFTEFLIKIGVDEETAEEDACKMEHAISAKSFDRMKAFFEPYMKPEEK